MHLRCAASGTFRLIKHNKQNKQKTIAGPFVASYGAAREHVARNTNRVRHA